MINVSETGFHRFDKRLLTSDVALETKVLTQLSGREFAYNILFPRCPSNEPDWKTRGRKKVVKFAAETEVPIDTYAVAGRTLLVFDETALGSIPDEKVAEYLQEQTRVDSYKISNNCHDVAATAKNRANLTGRLYSGGNCSELIGWSNHWINYDTLPDATVLALDFTASTNTDYNAGNFDTLGVRTDTMPALLARLGQLYGGEWEERA